MVSVHACPVCGRLTEGRWHKCDFVWKCLCGWEETVTLFGVSEADAGTEVGEKMAEALLDEVLREEG